MKRTLLAIVAAFVMITSANAQRLTDIQAEARFITDKMIVELGLNSAQRNSLLNINLNYLDGIRSYRDIDAYGWHYRNKQLKRMLNARQWKRFKEAYYFYHPIGWNNNTYIYNIYNKYPKHNYRPNHPHPHYYGKPYKYDKKWKHDKKRYEKEYKHDKKRYDRDYKYDKHYKHGKREFDNNSRKTNTWREKVRRDMKNGGL
ncbi:hypothetical protein [Prevotella sp.]|uniref:hypothetical protein n=1 Tax=Prevotella sp. TaxID=59823 RepID=UPI0025E8D505|nr:hypothetical protein [Prevotella sp.]MCI7372047.1 hypothetical protein [Prevotella sp.]MDD6199402.1 hypothetical protein [Prevotella sp.]